MKKLNTLQESTFLKAFFAFVTGCFLIGAVCMPDRAEMLAGLWRIVSNPSKISTNYFAVGGYAATFLNMGLVCLICTLLYCLPGAKANNVSTLAFLLTAGFCSWGIHVLNVWPTFLGVALYALVKKEKLASQVNAMLFSTGIAPLITELMVRYLHPDTVGFTLPGVVLSLAVGIVIGFTLPAGLVHAPKVHKGFDLYNAAVPVGMMAFALQGILYKATGAALPAAPDAETLKVASRLTVNVFCCTVFGLCVLISLLMGGSFRRYWKMLRAGDQVANVGTEYGMDTFLMNVGIYGLFILAYYNLVGASFNGVTFGIIFCMLACCNSGSNPATVWPIMAGYVLSSLLFGWLSGLVGGTFTQAINAQAILVGLCYANGLSPISAKYGWPFGLAAGMLHYCMVTTVPNLHGGYCLYNGGFTAAFVCLLLVPMFEKFFHTKAERRQLAAK